MLGEVPVGMPGGNSPGGGNASFQSGGMPGSGIKMGETFGNMSSSAAKTSFKQKFGLVSNAIKVTLE